MVDYIVRVCFVCFFHHIYFLRTCFLSYSGPGSHIFFFDSWLFSPPPQHGWCLAFLREKTAALSSLVDSRGTVPTHARRSHQLTHVYFFTDEVEISPRWDSNSRAQHHAQYSRVTTIIDPFRGNKYLVCVKRINLALQAA